MVRQPPLLNDRFWAEDYSARLHEPTVLRRLREDMSTGRPAPITVAEVFEIAQREMNFRPDECIFAEGEVARPLFIVGAVWGHNVHGISLEKARSLGNLLSSWAGGDAIMGGPVDRWEKKADELLTKHLGRAPEFTPVQTEEMLQKVVALLK